LSHAHPTVPTGRPRIVDIIPGALALVLLAVLVPQPYADQLYTMSAVLAGVGLLLGGITHIDRGVSFSSILLHPSCIVSTRDDTASIEPSSGWYSRLHTLGRSKENSPFLLPQQSAGTGGYVPSLADMDRLLKAHEIVGRLGW
jgi:hypothetical protein